MHAQIGARPYLARTQTGERADFKSRTRRILAITFGQQRAYRRHLEKLERWPVSRAALKDLREKLAGSPSA